MKGISGYYYFLCIFILALLSDSCQKEQDRMEEQEVIFGVNHIVPSLKLDWNDDFPCPLDEWGKILTPGVAGIRIKNSQGLEMIFTPAVFYLNGGWFTQSIKMMPGKYIVAGFSLRTSPTGPIIMATPATGSAYATYITPGRTVEFSIDVNPLEITAIAVEVLCWMPSAKDKFEYKDEGQNPTINTIYHDYPDHNPPN